MSNVHPFPGGRREDPGDWREDIPVHDPNRKARVANVNAKEHCKFCCGFTGFVVVGYRQDTVHRLQEGRFVGIGKTGMIEEYGPCPACEAGAYVEYPAGNAVGPWGSEGFWQGQENNALQRMKTICRCTETSAPKEETIAEINGYLARLRATPEPIVLAAQAPPVADLVDVVKEPAKPSAEQGLALLFGAPPIIDQPGTDLLLDDPPPDQPSLLDDPPPPAPETSTLL